MPDAIIASYTPPTPAAPVALASALSVPSPDAPAATIAALSVPSPAATVPLVAANAVANPEESDPILSESTPSTHASLVIGAGNAAVTYTAIFAGAGGNLLRVAHVAGDAVSVSLSADGKSISIGYASRKTIRIIRAEFDFDSGFMVPSGTGEYGKNSWSSDGNQSAPPTGDWYYLYWKPGTEDYWLCDKRTDGEPAAQVGSDASSADEPEAATWTYADSVTSSGSTSTSSEIAAAVNLAGFPVRASAGGNGAGSIAAASFANLSGGLPAATHDPAAIV